MTTDPFENAQAQIDGIVALAEANVARAQQLEVKMASVRGRSHSRNDGIFVEVDSNGRLQHLELEEQATELPASELAREIMQHIQEAHREASKQALDVTTELFGEGSPTSEHVKQTYLAYNPTPKE